MARPRIYLEDRVVAAVRLPRSTHQKLQEQAKVENLPVNVVMATAIDLYLTKVERSKVTKVHS